MPRTIIAGGLAGLLGTGLAYWVLAGLTRQDSHSPLSDLYYYLFMVG